MHGRLKVKTTEQQREEKRKERAKKLELFRAATKLAFSKRKDKIHDKSSLKITTDLLSANSEFYTLWNFRKEIILDMKEEKTEEELKTLFKNDLEFTAGCLRNSPKSYGAWHHRCWVMKTMPDPNWKQELKLCNMYLSLDERNFHCWDYRRFIVKEANIPDEDELKFSSEKIETNFSNYSSWHYRSKLLPSVHPGNSYKNIDEAKLLEEFELVQNAAFTDPNDQSAWFYHRWLLGRDEKKVEIYSMVVNKIKSCILITFTTPVCIKTDSSMVVYLDDEKTKVDWIAPNKNSSEYSHIWICNIPSISCNTSAFSKVKVIYSDAIAISCDVNKNRDVTYQEGKVLANDLFRSNFSSATVNFLKEELNSCRQLQELEPDNKWTILTSVLLMKAIDSEGYLDHIIHDLKKLTEIDVDRAAYYHDLRSRLIMEGTIENKKLIETKLDVSGKELTSLYHAHFFVEIENLNLSNNLLKLPSGISNLRFLIILNLNNNNLENCDGVEAIENLEELFVENNRLGDRQSISSISKCTKLKSLSLKYNPVCDDNKLVDGLYEYLKIKKS